MPTPRSRDGYQFHTISALEEIKKQTDPLDIINFASFVELDQQGSFVDATDKIQRVNAGFKRRPPHVTLLTLYDKPERLSDKDRTRLLHLGMAAREVLRSSEAFEIEFNNLRLGLLSSNGKQTPGVSNGTVVAMASPESDRRFLELSSILAEKLQPQVKDLNIELKRPHGGLWSTLGFFDCKNDIPIIDELEDVFYDLWNWKTVVKLDAVALCEATLKSLEDAKAHDIFPFGV